MGDLTRLDFRVLCDYHLCHVRQSARVIVTIIYIYTKNNEKRKYTKNNEKRKYTKNNEKRKYTKNNEKRKFILKTMKNESIYIF